MFKVLARLNRVILPSMIGKDLTKLNSFQKLIIASDIGLQKIVCNTILDFI